MNEPTEYPQPNATHGSYHWIFERLISASLVPMVAVATVKHGACGTLDAVLSATLLMHSHIGFDALLVDYLDKRKFPVTGPVAKWILRAATVATAVGLYGTYLLPLLTLQSSTRVRIPRTPCIADRLPARRCMALYCGTDD